ncbi:dihydropteroate synthase [Salinisphaera aquimarina]|uniref:Dihydropteroate synthase n=1 Tax=Salinisphaera aquimarina TaxID=2094031 RepID=A0ABV7ESW1_9GAMM
MQLVGPRSVCDLSQPAVMGILNVTPDSFSDGGSYASADAAVARALSMVDEGAAIIDIGGESTRPGASPVTAHDECERVLPVIRALRAASDVFISIDTLKPDVMRAACAAGADMINDVNALQAPGALDVAVEAGAAVCLMHMQGEPRTMQAAPQYDDVVADIKSFLAQRVSVCEQAGIARERICVDPGFGFGKSLEHNLELMRELGQFADADLPLLVGVSRKTMFARLFGRDDLRSRVNGSVAAAFWAVGRGARIIRCHDIRDTCQVLHLARSLEAHSAP